MIRVLVLSAEPRLIGMINEIVESPRTNLVSVASWTEGQKVLLRDRFDLAFFDYEALRGEKLNAFIHIDNILLKENTVGVQLVRQITKRSRQIEETLQSIRATVDMSQGKDAFVAKVERYFSQASAIAERHARESSDGNNVLDVEVNLPEVTKGKIGTPTLMRLFYTLRVRKETGVLELNAGANRLQLSFERGEIVLPNGGITRGDVIQAFSWSVGQFQFTRGDIVPGTVLETLPLLLDAVTQVSREDMVARLQHVLKRYPVRTNLWEERRKGLASFAALQALLRICNGDANLSEAANSLGSFAAQAVTASYFAVETDLLYLHKEKGARGANVKYGRDVRRARQKVADSDAQKTKAFRAASDDRSSLEAELTSQLVDMRKQTPHEIFGVWEGCGRKVVQEQFYKLVKEHHPDVYGGNTTGRVKSLAQDVFIIVKESYQELLKVEKDQTAPPPASWEKAKEAQAEEEEANPFSRKSAKTGLSGRPLTASDTGGGAAKKTEAEKKVDVKSRLQKLSGFRRRQERIRRRSKPGEGLDFGSEGEETLESSSALSEASEPSEPSEPEVDEAAERKAKLDALLKKAQSKSPGGNSPARDAFNEGYRAYRGEDFKKAYEEISKAYELDPESALHQTFYGFLMFRLEPDRIDEAEETIRNAMQKGDRQSLPDACVFLGHILKARGESDKALRQYERALRLNPGSIEAQREIRLAKMRGSKRTESDPGTFVKKLFKK